MATGFASKTTKMNTADNKQDIKKNFKSKYFELKKLHHFKIFKNRDFWVAEFNEHPCSTQAWMSVVILDQ